MGLHIGFIFIVATLVDAAAIPTSVSPLLFEQSLPRQNRRLLAIPAQVLLERVYLVLSQLSTASVVGIAIAGLLRRRGRARLDLPCVAQVAEVGVVATTAVIVSILPSSHRLKL